MISPIRSSNRSRRVAVTVILACGMARAGIAAGTIGTVVGANASNLADASGFGSVSYDYRIGKYEVTHGQYAAFLNAVAATDTYSLYRISMATDHNVAGIVQSGS